LGFVDAVRELGALEQGSGLESYLKYPFDKEGKVLKVHLDVVDPKAEVLDVRGVKRVELADHQRAPEMKLKYLYRLRVGANVTWGFSPIHFIGRPKKGADKNRVQLLGEDGEWEEDRKSHLNKICNRVLQDYEKMVIFTEGSVKRIMAGLEEQIDAILENWVSTKESHLIIFGADHNGDFLYPGEIPAFVQYFQSKLQQSLRGKGAKKISYRCALCGKEGTDTTTLSKVFKFSTADKVNFLPGLDKTFVGSVFPVCTDCFENVSAGREKIERLYSNNKIISGLQMWIIPEAVGGQDHNHFKKLIVDKMDRQSIGDSLDSFGEKSEERFLSYLAKEGQGLIFHFMFWERNNAQELVHLMVEDVPPERLAYLEERWIEAMNTVFGDVKRGKVLDWAIKSLYAVLSQFAGQSKGDRIVMRDFAIKTLGKLLRGERLPVATFKSIIASRVAHLVYEASKWDDVTKNMLYAQVWVEFMQRVNEGVVQ
jgi:CRISPR-associated protein Csh1